MPNEACSCSGSGQRSGETAHGPPTGAPDGPLLPVGLQIMAPTLRDDLCYRIGATFETAYNAANGPVLAHARPLTPVDLHETAATR